MVLNTKLANFFGLTFAYLDERRLLAGVALLLQRRRGWWWRGGGRGPLQLIHFGMPAVRPLDRRSERSAADWPDVIALSADGQTCQCHSLHPIWGLSISPANLQKPCGGHPCVLKCDDQRQIKGARARDWWKSLASEYYIVSFLCSKHDQEGSGSKKRCVIDALSRSLPTASRKLLPTGNEFRQTRAPASPADFQRTSVCSISGWKNNDATCTRSTATKATPAIMRAVLFICFLFKTYRHNIFICYNAYVKYSRNSEE